MEKMFCLGLMFGAIGGALLVANSYKARSLVKKSQYEVMEKVNALKADIAGKDCDIDTLKEYLHNLIQIFLYCL